MSPTVVTLMIEPCIYDDLMIECPVYVCSRESKVRFHSSSALGPAPSEVAPDAHLAAVNRLPTDWLAYDEMTRLHRSALVKSCTVMSPVTVAIFAGPAKLPLDAVREAECSLYCECQYISSTHPHTRLTALFRDYPGEPVPEGKTNIWILLMQETVSGSGISWAVCKYAPRSKQITMASHH